MRPDIRTGQGISARRSAERDFKLELRHLEGRATRVELKPTEYVRGVRIRMDDRRASLVGRYAQRQRLRSPLGSNREHGPARFRRRVPGPKDAVCRPDPPSHFQKEGRDRGRTVTQRPLSRCRYPRWVVSRKDTSRLLRQPDRRPLDHKAYRPLLLTDSTRGRTFIRLIHDARDQGRQPILGGFNHGANR